MKTKVKFLHENATFQKAYPTDSGYDLTACGYEYKGNGLWHIKLGVAVQPPKGYYFEVVPRSSFSKKPFVLANEIGCIDQSYRGEIMFPVRHRNLQWFLDKNELTSLNNVSWKTTEIISMIHSHIDKYLMFQRIAQAILREYHNSEIEIVDELNETDRGANGFGSSGQ
jgi:dUTP pyrophosphatase